MRPTNHMHGTSKRVSACAPVCLGSERAYGPQTLFAGTSINLDWRCGP